MFGYRLVADGFWLMAFGYQLILTSLTLAGPVPTMPEPTRDDKRRETARRRDGNDEHTPPPDSRLPTPNSRLPTDRLTDCLSQPSITLIEHRDVPPPLPSGPEAQTARTCLGQEPAADSPAVRCYP